MRAKPCGGHGAYLNQGRGRRMKVTVRMDDITPDMDWESFASFERMFDRYQIRPLLGIVPENRDEKLAIGPAREDFWEKMRALQKKGWTLAMHGCHHLYRTEKRGAFPLNSRSEFAGLSEEEQKRLLQTGRRILEAHGISPKVFMAPGHTFDRTTIRLLSQLGFSYVTDGYGRMPYRRWGMTFLPISFLRSRMFQKKDGFTTLVIHCNRCSQQELENYEKMFLEHRDFFAAYEAYLSAPAKKQSCPARAAEYVMAWGKGQAARRIGR